MKGDVLTRLKRLEDALKQGDGVIIVEAVAVRNTKHVTEPCRGFAAHCLIPYYHSRRVCLAAFPKVPPACFPCPGLSDLRWANS